MKVMNANMIAMVVSLMCLGPAASASTKFVCQSKYFNGQGLKLLVSGVSVSQNKVDDVTVTVDNDKVAGPTNQITADASYRPARYKGYNKFVIGDQFIAKGWDNSFTLLLPESISDGESFVAYLTEQASDGGSSNKMFCKAD